MATIRFVVMSDSHGDFHAVQVVKEAYEGKVDAIFHNGDTEMPASDPVWSDLLVVRGNCDWDTGFPNNRVCRLGDVTIVQTHGHLYGINFTWAKLDLFAQSEDADICLYGHLHRPAAWRNGKTIFINPGSVSQPRGEIDECLYAIVTVTESKIAVDFYTLDHQLYQGLSQEFER